MSQWSANINVMMKAARSAGRSLMRDYKEVDRLQVSRKGPVDFVNRANRKSEELLQSALFESRPNYGFLAKEGGETKGIDPTRRWIVNPLDGISNFLHGLPHWGISIALEHKKEIVAAVIFNPMQEEIYVAEKGAGAWFNDQRIRVSARHSINTMLFATGLPFENQDHLPQTLRELAHILPACSGVRHFGVASLDLAYVAAGRYDGYWERHLKIWDIAAGILLVKEAGGFVQAITPEANPIEDGTIIASNTNIFKKLSTLIREA